MTYKDLQREKRKIQKKELKEIEGILHPNPKLYGCEIMHEHKGRKIIFTAWIGDEMKRDNDGGWKFIPYFREDVLYNKNFYKDNWDNFGWLCS